MTTIAASSHSPSSTAGNLIFHCQEDAAKVCALDEFVAGLRQFLPKAVSGRSTVHRTWRFSIAMWIRKLSSCLFVSICLMVPTVLAQAGTGRDEIPIERCGILPIVKVRVGRGPVAVEMRFLVDTAATTTLNLKVCPMQELATFKLTRWPLEFHSPFCSFACGRLSPTIELSHQSSGSRIDDYHTA